MKRFFSTLCFLFIVMPSAYLRCSMADLAGGGTIETTNGCITGRVVFTTGSQAPGTLVKLIPSQYDPLKDTANLPFNTTDSTGRYVFPNVASGDYTIQFVHSGDRTRALVNGVTVVRDTVTIPDITLQLPGAIKVMLPDSAEAANGYMYIPGTTVAKVLSGSVNFVILDSVPAATISGVYYSTTIGPVFTAIRYSVRVTPGDTAVIFNPDWKYARQLVFNTSAAGAGVQGDVYDFPVLVRLTAATFTFTQAKAGGADLRFTKADNTFLPYEIEKWNSVNQLAEIWVKVDTIIGDDSAQSIMMYWGNPGASDSSNSAAVFDTANGFQGVWHLSQPGNTTAFDATGNHYDGTPSGMSAASAVEGMIGVAQQFNGTTSYFDMAGTASGKLSFPENGTYTLSAWVYATAIDSQAHYVISKSTWNYNLDLSGYNFWEIYDYQSVVGWESNFVSPTAGEWKYLTGVRNGTDMRLYIDGECMDTTIDIAPGTIDRDSTFNVQIGKRADCDYGYWSGMIDEVNAVNVSRNPDWIKLCYMNQKAQDALVQFR